MIVPANLVNAALSLGFSLAEGMQRALGKSLSAWGAEHGFSPSEVSMCLRLYEGRVYAEVRDALAASLGTSRDQVDTWISQCAAAPEGAAA